MTFPLPSNVTAQRRPLSPTSYEYILRHSELGQLGRILLNAEAESCSVTYEVHGESNQKITAMRREVLEPLVKSIYCRLAERAQYGLPVSIQEEPSKKGGSDLTRKLPC
jgi:hypothetical protein